MFDWIRTRSATRADLEAQLGAAQKALDAAKETTAAAVAAFDENPDDAATKCLTRARATEAVTVEHVARAQRLLEAAVEREAAELRAKQLERKRELEESLEPKALMEERAPSLHAEVEALTQAAAAHARRQAVEAAIAARTHELDNVRVQLGEPRLISVWSSRSSGPSGIDVGDALAAFAETPEGSAHSRYLHNLCKVFGESPRKSVLIPDTGAA